MSFLFNFPSPDEDTSTASQPFTFSFSPIPNSASSSADEVPAAEKDTPAPSSQAAHAPTKEHVFQCTIESAPSENPDDKSAENKWNNFAMDNVGLFFLCPQWIDRNILATSLPNLLGSQPSQNGDVVKSDIVPKVYEGGFRVWDGACDLLVYLISESPVDFQGKKVLELGCGAGLPGIYALTKGATVHFHDYNADVIECATLPNILKNLKPIADGVDESRVRLFSGDWLSFVRFLRVEKLDDDPLAEDNRYDVILTGDTVYRQDVLSSLAFALPRLLRKEGTVYLAGKSIYFGLNGGTEEFRQEITKENLIECVDSKVYPDCVQREVLNPIELIANDQVTRSVAVLNARHTGSSGL
ncbi:histidine protein methyltransferase 1 homolog [Paramacrobiotus metropolitanus]|uniref:histidine protein methyltransferase 1 homolog n=1 Tax=Paramacrobiotus metropolitanus TaxID=2943436 RepID=UPI0024463E24|nr:histidine protein methyltransferase 1 homolog [Paramacrobiotus metropolitanus]